MHGQLSVGVGDSASISYLRLRVPAKINNYVLQPATSWDPTILDAQQQNRIDACFMFTLSYCRSTKNEELSDECDVRTLKPNVRSPRVLIQYCCLADAVKSVLANMIVSRFHYFRTSSQYFANSLA